VSVHVEEELSLDVMRTEFTEAVGKEQGQRHGRGQSGAVGFTNWASCIDR
jgi:hypothetical protein